ncbi:MAG: PAS domain S-box protein, partial [Chloroflexota bacterium]
MSHLHEANPAVTYECPHGLVDNATPIIIDGIHYGNFFTGQFFLEEPDTAFFKAQAQKYGFNEEAYLNAVKKVPVWSREQLNSYLFFIKGLIAIISESGLKKLEEIEAREQIEKSEERANAILHLMHDGFWIMNPQGGQIIDTNEALCDMLGYTREEMLILSVADVEANDTTEEIAQRIQHIIQSGSAHFESRFRRKDGTCFEVEISVTHLPKRNLLFGFHRDISERVRLEAERGVIAEIKQGLTITKDLREFMRLIHQAIRKVMYADNFAVVFYHQDSGLLEEVYSLDQYAPPASPSKLEKSITAYVCRSGEPLLLTRAGIDELDAQGDLELMGTPPACWLGVPLNTPEGTAGVMAVQDYEKPDRLTIRDRDFLASISSQVALAIERKRADDALRESQASLAEAQSVAHIGSWEWDMVSNTVKWSDEMYRIFGFRLGVFDGKPETLLKVIHPDDRAIYVKNMEECLTRGVTLPLEYRVVHPDGTVRTLYADGVITTDKAGKPVKNIGTVQDITERKLIEENERAAQVELQRLLEEANKSRRVLLSVIEDQKRTEEEKARLQEHLLQSQKMESVGRLAGGVAHDFNNMLGVIIGHAEMALAKTLPDQNIYPDLREILKATQRSADLTHQLLAFARKQIANPKVLDLTETVASMLKMLRRLIGENIELIWHPNPDLWFVKMDPSHIDQILANLLVNARDAIEGEGRITIETVNAVFGEADCAEYADLTPGEYVLLEVSDNGSGMDSETLTHIFEPFYTTKDVGKGTGLGLATVFGIVKQNNGYIYVYSEPGQGTTFKIYLHRSESEAVPVVFGQKEETASGGMETVLIVEDEEALLELGKDTLEALGYTVLIASTPDQALHIAEEHAGGGIQLLITDVVMPGMNGRKLAEKVKAICPGLACLFMSGYTADIIANNGVLDEDVY